MNSKDKLGPDATDAEVRPADTADVGITIPSSPAQEASTADAPDPLICVLNGQGRIRQVNRAIQRFGFSSVTEVLGRDLHGLLHPTCRVAGCPFAEAISECCAILQREKACEADLHDLTGARRLHLSALRVPYPMEPDVPPDDGLAIVVVTEATALRLRQDGLRTVEAEIDLRVQTRTEALVQASRYLRDDLSQSKAQQESLRRSCDELAKLARGLLIDQEFERKGVARELYGEVAQSLSAIKYSLERAEELARRSGAPDLQPLLQRAIALIQDVIDDARGLAMKLRPCVLDDLGAASAIGWFFREFSQAHPGIDICTRITVLDSAIPERLGTACFRIVQELLRNVTDHDRPRTILVSLGRESEQLVLEVIDQGGDGNVIARAAPWRGGAGFVRVRERALMSGGQFSLRPAADGFETGVRIQWPLSVQELTGRDGG